MQATVQVDANGTVVAVLDSEEYAADEDDRSLMNLKLDDMLDHCARVAIAAWFEIRSRVEAEDGE